MKFRQRSWVLFLVVVNAASISASGSLTLAFQSWPCAPCLPRSRWTPWARKSHESTHFHLDIAAPIIRKRRVVLHVAKSSVGHEATTPNKRSSTTAILARNFFNVNRSIFLFYTLLGNFVIPRLIAPALKAPSSSTSSVITSGAASAASFLVTSAVLSMLWLGFVLAISGMEAWLKFRTLFVPRPLLLDVGRTVFPALNAVELALCGTAWRMLVKAATGTMTTGTSVAATTTRLVSVAFAVPTTILVADVLFLTPRLAKQAKYAVYDYLCATNGKNKKNDNANFHEPSPTSSTNSAAFLALQEELNGQPVAKKKGKWHVVYVVLELCKVIGLSIAILGQLASFAVLRSN